MAEPPFGVIVTESLSVIAPEVFAWTTRSVADLRIDPAGMDGEGA
jgi:hypothetical protein